jgi:serine/threonine-protein kinase
MEFRILGPLEVLGDSGPLKLGGPKQRAVLAHLILRSNRVVPAGLLIDELWGEDPPETARNTLQTYVYRLRKLLGDTRIEAGSGGYLLHAEPDEIDAGRFETLVKEAKGSLASDPPAALATLDQALSLWRGDPLADLSEEPSLRGDIARLEELRLAATEHRIATELAMGSHTTVVSELEVLTARYPHRERLWAHLMLALYRGGRQAEALDAYERARQVLASELGADPSSELQRLHGQILSQDPELKGPVTPAPVTTPPSSRADLEPGAEFAGYRIDRIIGRGGMGVVYLAQHEGLKRRVALKLLAPQLADDRRFRERFVRESQLAASIDHPNVIPIYEAGDANGRLFIAMRYVEGTDLRTLLGEQGTLDTAQASRIISQVGAALDAAYEQGLVHRDVKPANVLIARRRGSEAGAHGYLTDFGLTKRSASDSGVTGTGQFVGTLDYAAPEQFRGEDVDARTDVYSLGCVLYECLAGRPPFLGENDAAVMFGHLMEPPPPLTSERPDLPKDIDDVVATAMAKEKVDRYPSAGTFASRASAALGHPVDESLTNGPTLRRRVSRRSPSRRRPRVTIGAVAAVMVVVLVVALLQIMGAEPARARFQPGIAIVDQVTGDPVASIPTSRISQPAEAIYSDGSFWVHNLDPNSFVEIDPQDGKVLNQIDAPFAEVQGFAVDGDTLWVAGPYTAKIDIDLETEVDHFNFPEWAHGILVAEGSLWVAIPFADLTLRVDPSTGEVEHRFVLPGSTGIAYGDGSIWTAGWTSPGGAFTGDGGVYRIDPDTNRVTTNPLVLPPECCPVAAGGGFGWTADPTKGVVYKVDQVGQVVANEPTGPGASIGSYSDGVAWVSNSDVGTVVGIEALSGDRRTFHFEHPVRGLAAGSDVVLVSLGPRRTFEEIIDGLPGDVATFVVPSGQLTLLDPAVPGGAAWYWMESATCANLLTPPGASVSGGFSVQPEIAASLPDVSRNGLTYTFMLRSDHRFSPPSNEPVTAETFRYSIERALSPAVDGFAPQLIGQIEGEEAFLAGESEHISGLRAEGDTLTIELTEPVPDLLERISLPIFCPVPTETPLAVGGVGSFVGYPHRTPQAVPSAGPYYVADHLYGEYTILKPNPNYPGPRPQAFDAIVLREGIDPVVAVGQVENGSLDGIAYVFDPLLTPTGAVAQEYGGENESDPSTSYVAIPSPLIGFYAFNAGRQAFADPAVRRAAALALDRASIADLWGYKPTDQFLPPYLPGYVDRELYALDGSDIEKARALMRGRSTTAVMAIQAGNDRSRQEAEVVRSNLESIGISVEIEEVRNVYDAAWERGEDFDLLALDWSGGDWDTATYLIQVLSVAPPSWLPEGVAEELEALSELTGAERRSTAVALADRLAADEVPVAADLSGTAPMLLAPSLGCRKFLPFVGLDLASLCPNPAA